MATDHNTQVLTGWKAIAGYIRRDERTAMRWATHRGLPVRRVPGGKRGPVYAVPGEIALWLERAAEEPPGEDVGEGSSAVPLPPRESDDDDGDAADMTAPPPIAHPRHDAAAAPTADPRRRGAVATALIAGALAGALATATVLNRTGDAASADRHCVHARTAAR